MSLFELWALTTLPAMGRFMLIAAVGLFIVSGLYLAWIEEEAYREEEASHYARLRKMAGASVLCLFLSFLIPSERQLYVMLGGYYATNNAEVAKLPDNIMKAANAWLSSIEEAAKKPKEPKE